ncbi:esterase/lipase [Cladophialophora yegresii CBS 114405]|uniref:Esterase/lipase n=1 Tax=Cladophialophora yegresii CBS 114405 TaxID=1182544 RepID=W9W5M5_9EURO|nr:esterase/lipase [Cladophialophora yegresii CBS 114405]EXJ53844.1 esterase/lipase [Cladophialophora yegresii CBS 114405]
MTSHPPGACCYKGVKHEGEATGEFSQLGDFEIYTKYPEDKNTEYGILIITDVIGHRFNNAQLIADQFAANGYFVMMPDLFDKDPIPLNRPGDFDIMKWLNGEYHPDKKAHLPPVVDPIIDACLIEMRTKYNVKKLGAVGYCFGGKYVVRHLRPDSGKIDAGYTAHPSFVEAAELKDIKGPLAISAAETDQIFPAEKRHETEVILKELGLPYQINLYSGVEHGFAVRGDLKNRVATYAKENAFLQAVQWFEEHLRGGK